jgi:hypothetical protein
MKNNNYFKKSVIGTIFVLLILCSTQIINPVIGERNIVAVLQKENKYKLNIEDDFPIIQVIDLMKDEKIDYNKLMDRLEKKYNQEIINFVTENLEDVEKAFNDGFGEDSFYEFLTFCNALGKYQKTSDITIKQLSKNIQYTKHVLYDEFNQFNSGSKTVEELSFLQKIIEILPSENIQNQAMKYWGIYPKAMMVWNNSSIPKFLKPNEFRYIPPDLDLTWYGKNFNQWFDGLLDRMGGQFGSSVFKLMNVMLSVFITVSSFFAVIFTIGVFFEIFEKDLDWALVSTIFWAISTVLSVFILWYDVTSLIYSAWGLSYYISLVWFGSVDIIVYVYNMSENDVVGVKDCDINCYSLSAHNELKEQPLWWDEWWNADDFYYELAEIEANSSGYINETGWYSLNSAYSFHPDRWKKAVPPPDYWMIEINLPDFYTISGQKKVEYKFGPIEPQSTLMYAIEAQLGKV